MIWTSRKSFIRLGHATDQKRHLGLIRLRTFKMHWVSVANDHLGPNPLISDSATRMSLWPLQCQPVALDDNEWQISKTLIQSSIQTHGQVGKKAYFDIWHFWKSYCWLRLIWGLYLEPEPNCSPGAGAGADQKCHGSASLVLAHQESDMIQCSYLPTKHEYQPSQRRCECVRQIGIMLPPADHVRPRPPAAMGEPHGYDCHTVTRSHGHRWRLLWEFRPSTFLKDAEQTWQWNGLASECPVMCLFRWYEILKDIPHSSHANFFSFWQLLYWWYLKEP